MKEGYDPAGAVRLHEIFMRHYGDNSSFLGTHPASSERIENMRRIAAENSAERQSAAIAKTTFSGPTNVSYKLGTSSRDIPKNLSGQVGVVLTLKPRYSYLIFSGITPYELPEGFKVKIRNSSGQVALARVARSVEGYYSAVVDENFGVVSAGDSVIIE